tara:strand:- start:7597 stop:10488 length:2892 start_codon:yes stop_codon:yes gene_type:complete
MKNNILILTMFTFLFSQYDWQDNGVSVRQGIHIEWQRTGDNGSDGEMIFAWSDTRYGGRDIYAQKVDVNGNALWGSEGSPIVLGPGRQEDPQLITDGNGGAYIIWVDYRDEPDDGDIYAQHIQSDGSISWDPSGIPLTNVPGKQVAPNMCSDGIGGVFVIWNDKSVSTLGHTYGTHLTTDVNDIIAPGIGVPIISNDSDHAGVSIERAANGSAVLVWADDRNVDSSGIDVFTQRIDVDCNTLWSTPEEGGIPLCTASGSQEYVKVTYYSQEASVVVWEDKRYNENLGDIFIQYIDMDGNVLDDPEGSPICTNGANQIKPRVKADENGAYVVWEDSRYGPADIYVQRHELGEGPQFELDGMSLCGAPSTQDQPRLTVDGNGGAYVVWMDERYAPFPETEIFMQHVNSNGEISFAENGAPVCDASGFQFNPLVRNDGNGNVFAIWGDMRSGSIGLYTQHLTPANGASLQEDGIELYFGIDGNGLGAKSLYLGNNESLIYWEDRRLGVIADLTYGQKIYNGWESLVEPNGAKLCDNPYQVYPHAELGNANGDIFLGFGQAFGDIALHYQPLNNNLEMFDGDQGIPVYESFTPQNNFDLTSNSAGDVYFVFSDQRNFIDSDVYLQKYNNFSGVFIEPKLIVDNFFIDDNVQFIESTPDDGCFITYDSGDFSGTRAYAQATDSDGNVLPAFAGGIRLSSNEDDQFIKGLVKTGSGYFVLWKDQRSGSSDIYGQMIGFDGALLGPADGLAIATAANDQQDPSISYNAIDGKVMVCWEDFRNGTDFDVYCSEIDESTLDVSTEIELCTYSSNQKSPVVFATLDGSYLFAWEDSRGSVTSNLYYQEMKNNSFVHNVNGIVLCDADFAQSSPQIDLYDENSNSYIIYWDDLRSSGKEDLTNIYVQSVTIDTSSVLLGDLNGDGILNVIDVVSLVNGILGAPLSEEQQLSADLNGDGTINVIDIVSLVNLILS